MRSLKAAAAVVIALTAIIGGAWAVEQHYATRTDLAEVGRAFQQHVVEGQLYDAQKQIWQYQDRIKTHPEDNTAAERLRQLEWEKQRLEKKQIELKKEGM